MCVYVLHYTALHSIIVWYVILYYTILFYIIFVNSCMCDYFMGWVGGGGGRRLQSRQAGDYYVDNTHHASTLLVGSILHGVDPLSYFSFQPVLHDWYNKGRGMYYPVCGMVHIKEPLLLIDKSSPCGGSGFHFSLSEWSLTICLTPYNRR